MMVNPFQFKALAHNRENMTIPCSLLSGIPLGQSQNVEMLTQTEVKEILKRLWQSQHQALDMIGGGVGAGPEGYNAYFYEVVPVIPSKYRPILVLDGRRSETSMTQFPAVFVVLSERYIIRQTYCARSSALDLTYDHQICKQRRMRSLLLSRVNL